MSATLTPPLRIRRRTADQRTFVPALEARAAALARLAGEGDEAAARTELDAALRAVAGTLAASPHYGDTLRAAGLGPRDLQTLDDLRHFPVLDRATLAARWQELPHFERNDESVVVLSSGSTAEPVPVVKDRLDALHMWAALRFWVRQLRIVLPARPRVVLLCALPGGLEYSLRLPAFHEGALHRISVLRPDARARLARARPDVVFGDPDSLHWLAAQVDPPRPALVLSSASYLAPAWRESIPEPVLNYFATTETGPIAWECLQASARFHVMAPDVWVESLSGRLLVTRLRPSVLPLLRYATGDEGAVVRDACACGFQGWTITGFQGRSACFFVRPDGERVDAWRLAAVFKQYPLRSFQLVQTGTSDFALWLADEASGAVGGLTAALGEALRRLGWPEARVTINGEEPAPAAKPQPFRAL